MMYASRDMECNRYIFSHFGSFFALLLLTPKIKIWKKKMEKKPGATILLHICTINGDHMMSALILAVFHVGGHFWMLENQHPKN